ncbi:uncharacterized protein C5orf34 homolog isoform X2 [Dromaius novaehollandiae]|uniref:uncharacterized protein C5orf34 homolog isoform X2 n=1 Tax=Dromaius novaehollandiae TaxID=8790 RepID=UPI003120031D
MAAETLMALFGDGSVEVHYAGGARLLLSACGSEYRRGAAAPGAGAEARGQRVPFAVRGRREQLIRALDFRNKFCARPYLPSYIISPERKKILLRDILEVRWPDPATADLTTCINNGNVKISSVDGYAHLYLSELQQEFTVEFLCKVSQPSASLCSSQKNSNYQPKNQCGQSNKNAVPETSSKQMRTETKKNEHGCAESKYRELTKSKDQEDRDEVSLFLTSCSSEYAWVTQCWSVSSYPEEWKYPLSLALMCYNLLTLNNQMETCEENNHLSIGSDVLKDSETYETVSCLPTALPLSCSAPHLHRWSFCDFFQQKNEDSEKHSYPQLIQVVWYQGVFYRFIHGSTNIAEIYPDDGTFFKSEGAFLGNYFKHYAIQKGTKKQGTMWGHNLGRAGFGPGFATDQLFSAGGVIFTSLCLSCLSIREEKMYSINSLPPDIPGSPYSISSIITQATKILQYCYKTKLSLTHNYSICCWKMIPETDGREMLPFLLAEKVIPGIGRLVVYSDNKVHAMFWDGMTFNMVWDFSPGCRRIQVHENVGWCKLSTPDGLQQLIQMSRPGIYERSADAELEKIQRFNFLLENSNVLKRTSAAENNLPGTTVRKMENVSTPEEISQECVLEALEKTSKVIQDIESLLASSGK